MWSSANLGRRADVDQGVGVGKFLDVGGSVFHALILTVAPARPRRCRAIWPDASAVRMKPVGLEQRRLIGNAIEQEGHQRVLRGVLQGREQGTELFGVRAVVRRQAHADQQHPCLGQAGALHDGGKIVVGRSDGSPRSLSLVPSAMMTIAGR